MTLIGVDFSINKPAVCIFDGSRYYFMSWPYDPQHKLKKLYEGSGVNIINRDDDKVKGDNISSKMRYEVKNSRYLADLMFFSWAQWLTEDTYIGFEGLSYASSGDVVLQLGGYKYMLMDKLSQKVPLDRMFTYSPITVKSTAGCAKKGMGKTEMIHAFMSSDIESDFKSALNSNTEKYMKKGGKSFIDHVDDLVDAFFVLQTMMIKENIAIK
jgi:hypothetical protein